MRVKLPYYVHVTIRTTFKQCNKLSQSLVGIDYKHVTSINAFEDRITARL